MTEVELTESTMIVHVRGADQFWALKSQLKIPLPHVVGAQIDPTVVENWSKAFKGLPRINFGWWLPGVIKAGSSYLEGQWAFWDVHDPQKAITITLAHEHYTKLVLEVIDPAADVARIEEAVRAHKSS